MNAITGGCACGGVRYQVNGSLRGVIACHCEQCRRSSGHFVAATATRKKYFSFLQQKNLKWFQDKPGLRRGFCADCGSSLFFEDLEGERISITAGSLDNDQGLKIVAHIYAAEAGHYYTLPHENVPIAADGHHPIKLPD